MKSFVLSAASRALVFFWINVPEPAAPTVFTVKTQARLILREVKTDFLLLRRPRLRNKHVCLNIAAKTPDVTTFPTAMIRLLPGAALNAPTSFFQHIRVLTRCRTALE
jgi:hypothetical protein